MVTRSNGGADGIRTHDLLDAIEARSQLRHGPTGGTSKSLPQIAERPERRHCRIAGWMARWHRWEPSPRCFAPSESMERRVTGSKYLVEAAGKKLLVDCGLFQGTNDLKERNWNPLPVDLNSINYAIL